MNIFSFKQDANLLARIEVLETRVAILEGMVTRLKNGVYLHDGMLEGLISHRKANESMDKQNKALKLERQRAYARKYYAANKEAIKAKKRDKRPLVSPNQLELPEMARDMAVGGTS